jgi:hypothetical protein
MLLQFRIKCSMFSSSFALSKHFGSISFLYILIRLLCRMYVPVSSSFNFIGNLAASTAQWQLILNRGWIIPVFRFSTVKYYTSVDNNNFQHIRNWIWWTISQRKTTTYFGRRKFSINRTPYSTPAISTSYSPLQNDMLLDEELVWIDYIFNC